MTKMLNQHLPQYCGSCWAHGAMSSLADRVKIARGGQGIDIHFSIQAILNCGQNVAGSCYGGSASGTYQFIRDRGFIPFDTCLNYEACSSDSADGLCAFGNFSCSAINTCRTCNMHEKYGGKCREIDFFPNASIAEYGVIMGEEHMLAEIYARGPIACSINADPLDFYTGGILNDDTSPKDTNHIISIVGFGTDAASGNKYWIGRNSWGEYWGEMGMFRIVRGRNQLGVEGNCAWATPLTWTENNVPCYENGTNCGPATGLYTDPSVAMPLHMLQ